MARLPPPLVGVCIAAQQTAQATAEALAALRGGLCHVLFVSPERLLAPSFRRLAADPLSFPPVAMLAIDEAHCVTEWGHNFRPAYLRLRAAAERVLRPRCTLALTATATPRAVSGVCGSLSLPEGGVRVGDWHRPNLFLSASKEEGDLRPRALVRLLSDADSPLSARAAPSVIVYVQRQREAEAVADGLRSRGVGAAPYHAGMGPSQRARTQRRFTGGTLRVVVATVAFGLGIDKADVRGVVHWGAPRSPEDYLQQVGRAGRDGKPAHCHAFVGASECTRARALASGDGVSVPQSAALVAALAGATCRLQRAADAAAPLLSAHRDSAALKGVADPFAQANGSVGRGGAGIDPAGPAAASLWPEVAAPPVSVDLWWCREGLDLRSEVVETVLAYLESAGFAEAEEPRYGVVDVTLTRRHPLQAAALSPALGTSIALARSADGDLAVAEGPGDGVLWRDSRGLWVVRVDVAWAAAALRRPPRSVASELLRLRDVAEARLEFSRWSLSVRLLPLGVLRARGVVEAGATAAEAAEAAARAVWKRAGRLRAGACARVEQAWGMLREAAADGWRPSLGLRPAASSGTGSALRVGSASSAGGNSERGLKRARDDAGSTRSGKRVRGHVPADDDVEEMRAALAASARGREHPAGAAGAGDSARLAAAGSGREAGSDSGDESSDDDAGSEAGSDGGSGQLTSSPGAGERGGAAATLLSRLGSYFGSPAEARGLAPMRSPLRSLPLPLLRRDAAALRLAQARAAMGDREAEAAVRLGHRMASLEGEMRDAVSGVAGRVRACVRATVGAKSELGPARTMSLGLADAAVAWRCGVLGEPREVAGERDDVVLDAMTAAACSPEACARVLVGVGSELFPPQTWRMSSAWEAGAAFKAEELAAMAAAAGWGGGPGGMAPLLRGLDGAYELSGPESKA
ncbi:hypothetical protein FNF27_03061 [Cafeteria roenbergensis]|nr:hypothetical protein FNF27_03061 [Cafeteria roenbergensis]